MEPKIIQSELFARLVHLDSQKDNLNARYPLSDLMSNGIAVHHINLQTFGWFSEEAIAQAWEFSDIQTFLHDNVSTHSPPHINMKGTPTPTHLWEIIFKDLSQSVLKLKCKERTRLQTNANVFNLHSIEHGLEALPGDTRLPPWPRTIHKAFRRMMLEMLHLFTSPGFFFEGHSYDLALVKPAILRSNKEGTEALQKASYDIKKLRGQSWHRDFNAEVFPRGLKEAKERCWQVPGIVILTCLVDGTRLRLFTKSNRVCIYTNDEWVVLNAGDTENVGEVIEVTLHCGCILVMHGFTIHAGCDYNLNNIR